MNTIQELEGSIRTRVEVMLEEIRNAAELKAMRVGVIELPGEGLAYWDGVVVFGSRMILPVYFSDGENGDGVLSHDPYVLDDFIRDQLSHNKFVMEEDAIPLSDIAKSWVIEPMSQEDLAEILEENGTGGY